MIISKYIFKQTLSNVITSTLVFIAVIWLSQSFKMIKLVLNKGADFSDFLILSSFSFPNWLIIALPFGTFAGCMISYFRLENDKEIIVMKSAGLNLIEISAPAILISLITSTILLINVHFILPSSYKSFKVLQNEIRNSSESIKIKDNIFVDLNDNQTIFIHRLNTKNYFEEIFIQDRTNSEKIIELFAKKGFLEYFDDEIIIHMNDGTRVSTDKQNVSTIMDFKLYNLLIKPDKISSKNQRVVEYNEYNFFDLIKKASKDKANEGKLLAEAHNRNTVCLLPILYTLVAMIFILNGYHSREPSKYRKITSVVFLILIQIIIILIKNAAHFNVNLISIMYLFPISLIIISFVILHKNINMTKYFLNFKFGRNT